MAVRRSAGDRMWSVGNAQRIFRDKVIFHYTIMVNTKYKTVVVKNIELYNIKANIMYRIKSHLGGLRTCDVI